MFSFLLYKGDENMKDNLTEEIKKALEKDELFTSKNSWPLTLLLLIFSSNQYEGDVENV